MRHALVTGTSSGIGAAIAARLLYDGWRVTGVARRDPGIGHSAYTHMSVDLGPPDAVDDLLAGVRDVSAFVHAAGFMETAMLGALDHGAAERMWRVHVLAAEAIANGLIRQMSAGGRIVLIGSRASSGVAGRSQYGATKAALVAMARAWAIELAGRGITVNVVAPAATETPMLTDPSRAGTPPKLPPIGRYIRPEEVAGSVAFLLSGDAAAITGQTLTICGGASL